MRGRWDLMPESCRTVFNRRRRVHRWCVAYAMTLVLLGTVITGLVVGNASKEKERDALADQVEVHWMRNEEARELLEETRELESSIARFNRLAWPVRVSDAIAVLEPLIPDSTTLTSLTLVPREERPARTARGAKGREGKEKEPKQYLALEIEGVAVDDLDVARLVSALEEHRLFSTVNLDFARSREVDGVGAREFRLSCVIDLNRRYAFVGAGSGEEVVAP